jgi:hypothetical protein
LHLVYTISSSSSQSSLLTESAGAASTAGDLGGGPPEVDQRLHWHALEPCPFTREEGEVHCTYVASSMSRIEGDDMLKWSSPPP